MSMFLIAHPVQVSRYSHRRGSHALELNMKSLVDIRSPFPDRHRERQLVHVKTLIIISKHHSSLSTSRDRSEFLKLLFKCQIMLELIHPRRMHKGYGSRFVCLCVCLLPS